MDNSKKIFVIGFNKTGTTSIHNLFKSVGIKSYHGLKNVLDVIHLYDAFTDGEHFNFKEYYDNYPNSLFILNTRPIKHWLVSRYKHARFHNFKNSWCWPVTDQKTNKWVKERETHFLNVFSFFKDKRDSFCVVNIERKGWEVYLLQFIDKQYPYKEFHLNERSNTEFNQERLQQINENVENYLQKNGYVDNEIIPVSTELSLFNHYI